MSADATPFRFFSARTAAIFRAVAGRIVPSEPDSPGADSEAALRLADRAIADRPARDQRLLGIFLSLIERAPVLRYGRTFTKLPGAKQDAVLAFFENTRLSSKLRAGFFGVKTFALLGYYGSESTFAELRYPGPRDDAPYYRLRRAKEAS